MEIAVHFNSFEKHTKIACTLGLYETQPLQPIYIYSSPVLQHPDRVYVSVAILLWEYLSGPVTLSGIAPCSRFVARQIESSFEPLDVQISDQTVTPRGTPAGHYKAALIVDLDNVPQVPLFHPEAGETMLRFVDEGVGAMYAPQEVIVGTNLPAARTPRAGALPALIKQIGAAVLMAEDLHIDTIRVPVLWSGAAPVELLRVRDLLSAVSLKLEW